MKLIDRRNTKFFKDLEKAKDKFLRVDKELKRLAGKYGRDDIRVADSCRWKAYYYRDKMNYADSRFFLKKAVRAVRDNFGKASREYLDIMISYARLAVCDYRCGKRAANKLIESLLGLAGSATELSREEKARVFIKIADIIGTMDPGKAEQRKSLLEKALDLLEKVHGKKSPELLPVLDKLWELYCRRKNYNKALLIQRTILDIKMEEGPWSWSDRKIFDTAYKLAKVLVQLKKYSRAAKIFNKILSRDPFQELPHYSPNSPEYKNILEELANVYLKLKDYDKARELYRKARRESIKYGSRNCYRIIPVKKMKDLPLPAGGKKISRELFDEKDLEGIKTEIFLGADREPYPLLYAADTGYLEAARYIIGLGVDVNASIEHGTNALMLAAAAKKKDMVELLLSAGADPKGKLNFPLCGEIKSNNLYYAASESTPAIFKLIYDCAEVNQQEKNNALAAAASRGNRGIMDFLFEEGAQVTDSALEILLNDNEENTMKYLLEKGGNPDAAIKTRDNIPLLAYCAMMGRENYVKILMEAGADVNKRDPGRGQPPLMLALMYSDNYRIANILVSAGADLDALDSAGETALMKAARKGFFMTVSLLLRKGANKTIKNEEGKTAYDLAKEENTFLAAERLKRE
ncbi:MAG: ankyrin repeat domain-containing protein [Elusimicrobiota bacterium]|nr:ankyrin repeat domain-containing protein [Elusimicrobiota bacterium]